MDPLRLKGNLKKEYKAPYTNNKKFDEFYQGNSIQEFIDLPKVVYDEWRYWKNIQYYYKTSNPTEKHTFDSYFQEFKNYWQYNLLETTQVFREMELLSKILLDEWRIKYTFSAVHIYESYESCINGDYRLKTKAQLWEEFKIIWDLVPDNYSEHLLCEYLLFIDECESEYDTNYLDEYPRNFWEFRENSNYHSYDSYCKLEQYQICKEWQRYILDNNIN